MSSGEPLAWAPSEPSSTSSWRTQPSVPWRSKTRMQGAPSTSTATRWCVRGQTATSTTAACGPPSAPTGPPGERSCGTGTRREVGSKPAAQPPPLVPTPETSKSWPPAAPMSVSLLHHAMDRLALGPVPPRPTLMQISQVCVFQSRTKGFLPQWATASVVPSGPHCRLATGPLVHRRSVTHHGIERSDARPPWGQTRTMPRAPAVARHLPSGDQVTAGQAKASPRSDQVHHHPSCCECRQTAMPEDIPTASDPRTLLGCHARQAGKPLLQSACRY
mmetsp:Transcript_63840/g.170510  ORF Transcript_63840/g.170510 Transcript_63840/m.170510 type:complete len:275 (-) Transcript_63840:524-1348(-)